MKLKGEVIKLTAPKKIIFEGTEIDTDKIKRGELVARTIFSAISPGTETAAYAGKPALRPAPRLRSGQARYYPRLLGYCNVAKVIGTGEIILTGQSHRSIFKIPKKEILARVPKNVDPKDAALTYLYLLGLSALQSNNKKSSTVAVIGLGVLGLATVEIAKNLGLKVLAFSNSRSKLKLAKKLGAKRVFLKKKSHKLEKLSDLIINTSNSWADWLLALRLVKLGGTISVLGFPGRGEPLPNFNPLEPKYFYDKKISIIPSGTKNLIKKNFKDVLDLIAKKKLHPEDLISGVYDYKDIEQVYEKLLSRDGRSITYILKWPE